MNPFPCGTEFPPFSVNSFSALLYFSSHIILGVTPFISYTQQMCDTFQADVTAVQRFEQVQFSDTLKLVHISREVFIYPL